MRIKGLSLIILILTIISIFHLAVSADSNAAGNASPANHDRQENAVSATPSAGFAPLFAAATHNDYWDASFAGTHQAIIEVPWQTTNGRAQTALLTVNIGRSSKLPGGDGRTEERYVYLRVNFPYYPELPFDRDTNPYWWGASAICTEHSPQGELYANSLSRAVGNVDLFAAAESLPGTARLAFTMKVVAPDLDAFARYGADYARAGKGMLPKVATVRVELNEIQTRVHAPRFNIGNVTFTDEATHGFTATSVRFRSEPRLLDDQGQL